jgi:metal-responsive CopG/Arc/MetJ family transcriptional regulator
MATMQATTRVTFPVSDEMYEQLDDVATRKGISSEEVVATAIKEYLLANKKRFEEGGGN